MESPCCQLSLSFTCLIWWTYQRLCINQVRSLKSWTCAASYWDTVLNPGLKAVCLCSRLNYDCWFTNKQMLTLKKAVWWEERIHYWLVQKFGLWHLYKFETIQAKPSFLLPNQEEDKRRLCLLGVIHSTNLRFFRNFGTSYSTRHKSWNTWLCDFPLPNVDLGLQSSQCSKIRVAQHWGRIGAHLSENKGVKSECKKLWENSRQMASVSTICDEYCRLYGMIQSNSWRSHSSWTILRWCYTRRFAMMIHNDDS